MPQVIFAELRLTLSRDPGANDRGRPASGDLIWEWVWIWERTMKNRGMPFVSAIWAVIFLPTFGHSEGGDFPFAAPTARMAARWYIYHSLNYDSAPQGGGTRTP
jgi:hypothetical protein